MLVFDGRAVRQSAEDREAETVARVEELWDLGQLDAEVEARGIDAVVAEIAGLWSRFEEQVVEGRPLPEGARPCAALLLALETMAKRFSQEVAGPHAPMGEPG